MQKRWLSLLLLLFTLIGCQSEQPGTPASTDSTAAPLAISRLAQPITIGALAAAPEAYVDQMLQLTGQFQSQPRLICAADPKPSPANWGLVADGYLAYVQGFPQVNDVAVSGLTMTVEGRWRHWEGDVGCGPEVTPREIWYLEVSRILSPSSISRVTLTPAGGLGQLVAGIGETAVPEGTPTFMGTPAEVPTEQAGVTPPPMTEISPTSPPVVPPNESPSPSPSPVGEETRNTTPTLVSTAEGEEDKTTGTPTATPGGTTAATATPGGASGGSATPTPGSLVTGTPGPSPTPSGTIVDMGEMETQFLAVENLGNGEIHSWEIELVANSVITAYVATAAEDVVLTLISPNREVLQEINAVPGGQVEKLTQPISAEGSYRLQIRTTTGSATDYAMMLDDSFSYAFVLRGFLRYGSSQTASLPDEHDHFWHFVGAAGEVIRITIIPDGDGDPFIKVYDTEAEDISGFVDETGPGEGEIYDITLPASGLYSVRVGEFDFLEMEYTILITKSN